MTGDGFGTHDRLSPQGDGTVRIESVVFEARARPLEVGIYEVTVVVPTLESVVTTDDVGETVAAGWFETFERRVGEPGGAIIGTVEDVAVETAGEEVVVTIRASGADPDTRADDAATLAEYVEGTYVEGLIPGYAYREPVADLLEAATQRYHE